MPNLTKRGSVWHYSFNVEGRRFRFSARTADKDLAADIAVKHELRERRAAVHGPESVVTFTEAVDLYLDADKDSRFVLAALDWFGDTRLARITPPMIREAAQKLYPKASPATLNRQGIAPIQAIVNFAADKGLCQPVHVRRFPVERRERPAGDKNWLKAFQRGAVKWEKSLPRHMQDGRGKAGAALARFMFETGARIGQAAALTWQDIDLTAGTALLRTRKTGRNSRVWERTAYLTPAMVSELANLPKDRFKVFGYRSGNSIRRMWDGAIEAAGLKRLTPHEAGRHGYGTETIVRHGVDLPTAADGGGWKSRRLMLETYAHSEGQREMILSVFGTSKTQGRRKR